MNRKATTGHSGERRGGEMNSANHVTQRSPDASVLVVEDEVLIRLPIVDHLRDCGWRVLEATTADEAKALFLSGAPIDIVFSDVQMPGALDGIGLAHWIHDNHSEIKVLLTSGVAATTGIAVEVCEQKSIFRKPYDCEAVASRIRVLLT
jgi:CheY-like chemotaxis protein